MKNKFKKSKIIVPALALITATTAASVTGTVAWFTANRTASVTAGQFAVGTNEGELLVAESNGLGVTQSINAANSITIETLKTDNELNTLLDASYNGSKFYTDNENGTTLYKEVNQHYADDSKYWYAFSWTLTFTVDISKVSSSVNYDIFFDVSGSSVTENTSGDTASGLRVSMVSGTNARIIWAPKAASTDVNCHSAQDAATAVEGGYVKSTTESENYTVASASTHGLIANDITALNTKATNGSSNSNRGDWLGLCTKDTTTKEAKLSVNVVVWYDGLDKNVVNEKTLSNLSTNLKFYARENA